MWRFIPPPLVAALLAVGMWLTDGALPALRVAFAMRLPAAVFLAGAGLALVAAAVIAFLRHRTSINPMMPARATRLIIGGVYRISRNPIYLGDLLLLTAFATWLANAANIVFLIGFVWIMNRWQIAAEEQALQRIFGARYTNYCSQVRRWI